MYYKQSDIEKILKNIKDKYTENKEIILLPFGQNNISGIEQNVKYYRIQLMKAQIASDIIKTIKDELYHIGISSYDDFSLDVPTKCDGCFAQRANGICWVCAFTGDLSESGFYQKYGIMENCPFLTQKQVDDLAYDFVKNQFEMLHQENVDDLDEQFREEIKACIRDRFEEIWGGKSD